MLDNKIDMNQAVFTTKNVMKNKMTIVRVYHEHDGSWQFFDAVSTNAGENVMLVALENVLNIDSSISEVLKMNEGYYAERKEKNKSWTIFPYEEESE